MGEPHDADHTAAAGPPAPAADFFDAVLTLGVLDGIKGGGATFFREPPSAILDYVMRLRVCGAVSLFEGGHSVIATLTPSGETLRAFLACWRSTAGG